MARDVNKLIITGRLGRNPEVRRTPQGSTVASFSVASNHTWTTTDQRQQEHTEWFNIVAWNRLAEVVDAHLRQGMHVYVEGRLQTQNWTDQTSGQPRVRVEVIASDLIILGVRPAAVDDTDTS